MDDGDDDNGLVLCLWNNTKNCYYFLRFSLKIEQTVDPLAYCCAFVSFSVSFSRLKYAVRVILLSEFMNSNRHTDITLLCSVFHSEE